MFFHQLQIFKTTNKTLIISFPVSCEPIKAMRLNTTPTIGIKPLNNRKLHTRADVSKHTTHSLSKVLSVAVFIKPEIYHGEKVLTAKAVFRSKKLITFNEPYSVVKFVLTKHGLKEASRTLFKRSSVWYPAIKKIAQNSIHQYFQFKRYHKHVLKTCPYFPLT